MAVSSDLNRRLQPIVSLLDTPFSSNESILREHDDELQAGLHIGYARCQQ